MNSYVAQSTGITEISILIHQQSRLPGQLLAAVGQKLAVLLGRPTINLAKTLLCTFFGRNWRLIHAQRICQGLAHERFDPSVVETLLVRRSAGISRENKRYDSPRMQNAHDKALVFEIDARLFGKPIGCRLAHAVRRAHGHALLILHADTAHGAANQHEASLYTGV